MPSSTKCGVRLTDVLWTWLCGDLTRHFPETIHLSGERQLEKTAFRTSLIPVRFDSPQMCELHPSQAGVDIVATTLWLGHESMQPRTVELEVGLFFKTQVLQKVPPENQSSGTRKADKSLLTVLGTL